MNNWSNYKNVVARTGRYPAVRNLRPRQINRIATQKVSGRIKSRKPEPSSGLLTKGFGQKVSCIHYGSHLYKDTEERMIVFIFARDFFYILTSFHVHFSWQGLLLFLAISSVSYCVSDSLIQGEQP